MHMHKYMSYLCYFSIAVYWLQWLHASTSVQIFKARAASSFKMVDKISRLATPDRK